MNLIRDVSIVTAAALIAAIALVPLTVAAARADTVTVSVLLVTSYGDFDYEQPAAERGPDFFASLYIDEAPFRTAAIHNEANVAPNWRFEREVYRPRDDHRDDSRYVYLRLDIGDADNTVSDIGPRLVDFGGPVKGPYQNADINPAAGKTGIDLLFDLSACHLHSPGRDGVQITRAATAPDGTDACRFQVSGIGDDPMYSASAVFEITAELTQ